MQVFQALPPTTTRHCRQKGKSSTDREIKRGSGSEGTRGRRAQARDRLCIWDHVESALSSQLDRKAHVSQDGLLSLGAKEGLKKRGSDEKMAQRCSREHGKKIAKTFLKTLRQARGIGEEETAEPIEPPTFSRFTSSAPAPLKRAEWGPIKIGRVSKPCR